MQTYLYECGGCGFRVSCRRAMSDYKVGPKVDCPSCGSSEWKRKFTAPTLALSEDHNSPYPFKASKINRHPVIGPDGRQLVAKDGKKVTINSDQVFRNKREHQDWMKRNGYVIADSGRSPMVGPSQHSFYDLNDPFSGQAKMVGEAQYVSEDEVKNLTDRSTLEFTA